MKKRGCIQYGIWKGQDVILVCAMLKNFFQKTLNQHINQKQYQSRKKDKACRLFGMAQKDAAVGRSSFGCNGANQKDG